MEQTTELDADVNQELLSEFGKKVRKFRKERNWTLKEFSERCGMHQSSISQVERGRRNLTLNNLSKIAQGLDVEEYQLLLFETGDDGSSVMGKEQAREFRIEELINEAPPRKKELFYKLASVLLEWDRKEI